MFGIGYLELMVLGLLVILLFPPRELPKLARSAARAYGSVRRIADDFHRTVMLDDELRGPIDEIRGVYDEARWDIRRAGDRLKKEVSSVNESVNDGIRGALSPNAPDHDHFDEDASEQDFGDTRYDDGDEEDYLAHHAADSRQGAQEPQEEAYRNPYAGEPDFEDEHPPGALESSEMPPPFKPVPRPAQPPVPGTTSRTSPADQDAATPPMGVKPSAPSHPSLAGRVSAAGAGVPGAGAPLNDDFGFEPSRGAEPAAPTQAPRQDSDEIDESALTRVARLPMPPSLQKPSPEPPAAPKGDKPQEGPR